jgi:hypothetical protein
MRIARSALSYGANRYQDALKFLPAHQAHLVRPVLDRKYAALLPVSASEEETKNVEQRLHKSSARCRRSQLPLASSHASKARTLPRARAIEQSAAP